MLIIKKKWILLICLFLLVGCFLFAFIIYPQINSVSYIKEEVSLDNIKPNETVLIMKVVSYTSTCREKFVIIVNKNKQVKYVDLSNEKELKELSLNDYDAILQDKKIALKKERLKISDEMLGKIININNYKLEEKRREGVAVLNFTYYSVCGSGRNRKMVIMKKMGFFDSQDKNNKIDKLCDNMYELMEDFWPLSQ